MSFSNILINPTDTTGKGGWYADVTFTGNQITPGQNYNIPQQNIPDTDIVYALVSYSSTGTLDGFISYEFSDYSCPGFFTDVNNVPYKTAPLNAHFIATYYTYADYDNFPFDTGTTNYFVQNYTSDGQLLSYARPGNSLTYVCSLAQSVNPSFNLVVINGLIYKGQWSQVKLAIPNNIYAPCVPAPTGDEPSVSRNCAMVIRVSDCYQYPNPGDDPTLPPPDPNVKKIYWTCSGYKLNDDNPKSIWKWNYVQLYNSTITFVPNPCPAPQSGLTSIRINNVRFYYVGDQCPDGTLCCLDSNGNICCVDCCALGEWVLNNFQTYWL